MPPPTSIHQDVNGNAPDAALAVESKRLQRLAENPPEEIFVVSDFHLGSGRRPATGRYSRTENFLSDQAFSRFLDYAEPGPNKLLFINGDTFDFVRICQYPRKAECGEWSDFLKQIAIFKTADELWLTISPKEKRFGLETDDYKSAWKLLQIANGHSEFFEGLARWINRGGLLLLSKGNHDLELYWPLVRVALLLVRILRIALLLASPLLRITLLRIALLPLWRTGLNWRRSRCRTGLRHRRLAAWRRRRGAELAQPILELPVAELQLLVLAGQLPELVFQPLDPHFQVGVVGLPLDLRRALLRTLPRERDLCGRGLHRQAQHRGDRRGTGSIEESG